MQKEIVESRQPVGRPRVLESSEIIERMFGSPLLLFGLLVTWITPLWLLGVGVALGMIVLAAAYGILFLVSRSAAGWAVTTVREGVLLPIFYVASALAVFAVAAVLLVPGLPYRDLITAVARISAVGPRELVIEVPAATRDYKLEALDVPLPELRSFEAETNHTVTVTTNILHNFGNAVAFRITPGDKFGWTRPAMIDEKRNPVQEGVNTEWMATNAGDAPATLRLHTVTDIQYPQVRVVPYTALALIGLVVGYMALQLALPKVSAIALTTAKESMAQPLFYVALTLGGTAILAFIYVPYNTFGEDVKMLKDSGLTLIMVLSIIVAVWSASVSVSEEVEGRTALTVLSKPVRRRQFVLGKFLGILGPVLVLFIVLGILFLTTVSYKVVYDAREIAKTEPPWQLCYTEMIRTVPGLVLAFLETVVLASISVAISTRLTMVANLIVCASIYALGHLVPMLVNSSVGKFEIVRFVGQFIATILPVLDHFNIQAAVAAGATVPLSYLGMALVYCVLYSTIAMLLGLLMFEDRDLA